jgi:enoyl-CoA hydratase
VHISTAAAHTKRFLADLTDAFAAFRKPIVAAVVGFAVSRVWQRREMDTLLTKLAQVGGGFELALACDMIYAAEDAKFGLPEIGIGTMPGAGGTQRLTRALGKQKAMEFILTGETATGTEFERLGLISKVFPAAEVVPKAVELATKIASRSGPIAQLAKQAVLAAEKTHLDAGMELEKGLYYATFAYTDKTEGMTAFLQKREPVFQHQ